MKVLRASIEQAGHYLKTGSITPSELCSAAFRRAERIKELNAFVTLTRDVGQDQAKQSEARYKKKEPRGPLDGIPIVVKDNFCTRGIRTTCASRMLLDFVPPYDATVVERLLNAGSVLIGKCNLDEFAMGSGTVDSVHGPTRNAWGSALAKAVVPQGHEVEEEGNWRIAGGSSGGCAVAVATGAAFAGIGSDTGGSTRNPASHCGIVGFKPTYSTVSRHGLVPLVNSMDVPGILARTVQDAAYIYNAISGHDPKDSTTVPGVGEVALDPSFELRRLRVGIPREYYNEGVSGEVSAACEGVARLLEENGARLSFVSMPHTKDSITCYSVLNQCEVASNMCRYDGLRYGLRCSSTADESTHSLYALNRSQGLNQVVRGRILAGNYFLLKKNYERYFVKAMKVRRLIAEDFLRAWSGGVDALLTPTTPTTAPLLADYHRLDNREQCSRHDYCTQPVNMAGCPAVSIPVGLSPTSGLPLGVQLIAPSFRDGLLLSVAKWIQDRAQFPTLEIEDDQ